jgi:antitoxin CptB
MDSKGEARNRDFERLRWRCRRGLLELDLVLQSYLSVHQEDLSDQEIKVLNTLLDYPDNDLWDLISGRQPITEPATEQLLQELRKQTYRNASVT